jgi:hypothetical protein
MISKICTIYSTRRYDMQRSSTTYVLYAKSLKNGEILHNVELRKLGGLRDIGKELISCVVYTTRIV